MHVITVCRNSLAGLKLTQASVQAQRYADLSYAIRDGASTDGTAEFLQQGQPCVSQWISEPDRGIYDAMNKALSTCPDDAWVLFLNAGDRFASDDVLQRLSPLLAGDADFIFGDVAIRGADGVRIYAARRGTRLEMPGCHQSMLVRASLLKSQRFDTNYRVGADFEFYLRATKSRRQVAFFDGTIAEIAPEGFSAANEDLLQRDYASALRHHRGLAPAAAWLARRKLRAIALQMRTRLRAGAAR